MSKQALYDWCRVNRPNLALEMLGSSGVKQLALLNEASGLDISADSDMELSSALFLDALKKQKCTAAVPSPLGWQRGQTFSVGIDYGAEAEGGGINQAYRECMVSGTGMYAVSRDPSGGVRISSSGNDPWRIHESPDTIRAAATEAERARIMAVLETCRPTDQPYTRRDWAIEEKGKRDLFAKIMKALGVAE